MEPETKKKIFFITIGVVILAAAVYAVLYFTILKKQDSATTQLVVGPTGPAGPAGPRGPVGSEGVQGPSGTGNVQSGQLVFNGGLNPEMVHTTLATPPPPCTYNTNTTGLMNNVGNRCVAVAGRTEAENRSNYLSKTVKTVTFPVAYSRVPKVVLGIKKLDADTSNTNIRYNAYVVPTSVTTTGFDINLEVWENSKVYEAIVTWMAYTN
jgi:hypothetical protein